MPRINRRKALAYGFALAFALEAKDGGAQSIGQYIDDALITSKLKAQLTNDLGANLINIETKNGIVRLSGTAESRLAAIHAEQLAWAIEGVRAVQNELIRD
ncbi:MAG: BON domain-containing protein [Alphaproteobacteria bacterium]|nr:BON domain-containing protein [Alphaproteobacteria bacterium]